MTTTVYHLIYKLNGLHWILSLYYFYLSLCYYYFHFIETVFACKDREIREAIHQGWCGRSSHIMTRLNWCWLISHMFPSGSTVVYHITLINVTSKKSSLWRTKLLNPTHVVNKPFPWFSFFFFNFPFQTMIFTQNCFYVSLHKSLGFHQGSMPTFALYIKDHFTNFQCIFSS